MKDKFIVIFLILIILFSCVMQYFYYIAEVGKGSYIYIETVAYPIVGTNGFMKVYRCLYNGEIVEINAYTDEGCDRVEAVIK